MVETIQTEEDLIPAGYVTALKSALVPEAHRTLKGKLEIHIGRVKGLYLRDNKNEAYDGVMDLPESVEKKDPKAKMAWGWYWLFPARELTEIQGEGVCRRYHIHDTVLQSELREAVRAAQIKQRATSRTLRHTFATHMLDAGCTQ